MRHDVASILIIDLAGNFLGQKAHSVYLVCVLRYSRLHPQQLGQKTSKLPVQTTDIFRVEKSLRDSMTSEPSTSSHCPSNLPKVSKIVIAVLNVHIYIHVYIRSLCFRRKNLGSDKTRCKPADVVMQRTWMHICMPMNIPHFLSSDRPASLHLAHG